MKNEKPVNEVIILKKFFINELKSIYWVEKRLLSVLGKFERAASTKYLKASFKGHHAATIEQVKRLELIFQLIHVKIRTKKCDEMLLFFNELNNIIASTQKNTLRRDISLITVAEKIEHLEINKYNKLLLLSDTLHEYRSTWLIEETLTEEKDAEETFAAVKDDTFNDETLIHVNEETGERSEKEPIKSETYEEVEIG